MLLSADSVNVNLLINLPMTGAAPAADMTHCIWLLTQCTALQSSAAFNSPPQRPETQAPVTCPSQVLHLAADAMQSIPVRHVPCCLQQSTTNI